ncbi:MAG: AAA family ATPase [Planctomycetaceae bacterium]
MKIKELKVEGFRSVRSQTWRPGDLNVVIGPNASGKSNLLKVLEFLSISSRGGLGRHVQQEGGIDSLLWDGQADHLRVRAKMTPLPPYSDETKDALTYDLSLVQLGTSGAYQIDYEVLGNFCKVETGEMQDPFKLLERDARHAVVFSMASRRFESPQLSTTTASPESSPSSNASVPTTVPPGETPEEESLLSIVAGPFSTNRIVTEFQRELATWRIHQGLHTHREATIRAPQVTRHELQVSADGQNLISVLHSLYTGNRQFKDEVNVAMQAAFGDDFDELVFPPAADQRIQMRIRWRSLQREQSAADLSDGTLRFLFLLAVLANPSPPPLIAIDEPETGLHPSMFPIVAEFARDAANQTQVILTTHSPEFLDAFGDEPPTTTVVERHAGETTLRVVAGDELSYWLQQYTLGELFRSKELEAMK